ncbi:N-acetylmuramoyl-L-alanine amidase family protein [Rossellomorea sp. GCM10028870]|uniref:peptidoglycan recognition protein family protein n=1 Tax=Rossellomorea sp. GCM10028870 TaxID=3273426 RepID=UPI00360F6AF8
MVVLNYQKKHIRKNEFSRPGYKLLRVQAVMDHYTANPGADAEDHFEYFDKTIIQIKRYAGAHIFVDRYKALELIPLDEGTFGGNDGGNATLKLQTLRARDPRYPTSTGDGNANLLCIHVEMCLEPDGTIHPDTIKRTALVHQMLQRKFPQLKDTYNRFVRHFDVTGKNCPAPMVKNPSLYKNLLDMTHGLIPINLVSKPKEEEEMIKMAVVVYSDADLSVGYDLANEKKCGLYNRKSLANEKLKINELMVVGGSTEGLKDKTNRIIDLSGANRWDTRKKVISYLGK